MWAPRSLAAAETAAPIPGHSASTNAAPAESIPVITSRKRAHMCTLRKSMLSAAAGILVSLALAWSASAQEAPAAADSTAATVVADQPEATGSVPATPDGSSAAAAASSSDAPQATSIAGPHPRVDAFGGAFTQAIPIDVPPFHGM